MTRVVSVLEVAGPAVWAELERIVALDAHLDGSLGGGRILRPSFEKEVLPQLQQSGIPILIRYARRRGKGTGPEPDALERIARLSRNARTVLHTAQRHAIDGMILGAQAWDPESDAPAIRELLGAGLIEPIDGEPVGRYGFGPGLPPPPEIPYALEEAVMPEPDDLHPAAPGPVGLLHDLASLAAAIDHVRPKRNQSGAISAVDARKLWVRLAIRDVRLEEDPRWGRALRGLDALRVIQIDPSTRELGLDLGLEDTLAGTTEQAIERLIHKLVDADLHSAIPAVRAALRQAGDGAVDEVVFFDLLFEQHRDLLFVPWRRGGPDGRTYPMIEGDAPRPFDRDGFDAVEVPMLGKLLGRLERLGILRRAPGVFAGTPDGRRWARVEGLPLPPVWVSSDLEVVVPPDGVTPWERFQLERLGRCVARDVVDRYRLERAGIELWLRFHDLEEAIALLERRCPAVPRTAVETLTEWARSASRVVLTRGVLLPG